MVTRGARDFDGIVVETSDWPIVLVEFPEHRVPDAALHGALAHLETLMGDAEREGERVFFITDLSRMRQLAPASQRKYAGEWMRRTALLAKAASVGGAQVTPSAILRGAITAVFWIQPPPRPALSVATRGEAILRGIQVLEAASVPLSPRLLELREIHGPGPDGSFKL